MGHDPSLEMHLNSANPEHQLNDSVNRVGTQPGRFGKPAQQSSNWRELRRVSPSGKDVTSWKAGVDDFTAGWNHAE